MSQMLERGRRVHLFKYVYHIVMAMFNGYPFNQVPQRFGGRRVVVLCLKIRSATSIMHWQYYKLDIK